MARQLEVLRKSVQRAPGDRRFKKIRVSAATGEVLVTLTELPQINEKGGLMRCDGRYWQFEPLSLNVPILALDKTSVSWYVVGKGGIFASSP
jgi:hypothetical protein